MILKITENTTAKELQEEFAKRFPYLKIELYSTAHKAGEGSPLKNQLPLHTNIGQVTGSSLKGIIEVNGLTKVSELEQQFQDIFGISAQVFRKSNHSWLQTTATDSWTLGEQNNHARESAGVAIEKDEPGDYREQD
jgi:PAS domain-containing protein